jgi:hypothetical protein
MLTHYGISRNFLSFGLLFALLLPACGGSGSAADILSPTLQRSRQHSPSPSASPSALPGQLLPMDSDSFVNAIGVNTHLDYVGTPYTTDVSTVNQLLIASGIRHIRDALSNYGAQAYINEINYLGANGIKLNAATTNDPNANETSAFITAQPKVITNIESFETLNESNTGHGPEWPANLIAWDGMLYQAAQPTGLPVLGPSLTDPLSDYTLLGNQSEYMTYGNLHMYFSNYNPGNTGIGDDFPPYGTYGTISYGMNITRIICGTKPIMVTETGYDDSSIPQLPLPTKLKYTLRTLFDFWNVGVLRTYMYEFADEGGSSGLFGLIGVNAQPKPTYTAVKNLIAALTDPGASFATTPLSYSLNLNGVSTIQQTLLQKRNGSYILALWNEVPAWNTNTNAPITVAPQTVTLSLNAAPSKIAAATFSSTGSLVAATVATTSAPTYTFSISDYVTLVTITP